MTDPVLRLHISKGPRKGESLECHPGALFRVGRIVRGNNFAVRDPGASQRHLAFKFLPSSSCWAVSDLGSSNGTLVNGCPVSADAFVPLADGDEIKIGESTVIVVNVDDLEPAGQMRREAAAVRTRSMRNAEKDESFEEEEAEVVKKGRGRPRRKPRMESSVRAEEEVVEVEPMKGRQLRGRKPKVAMVNVKKEVVEEMEMAAIVKDSEEPPKGRQLRRRKPKAIPNSANVSQDVGEKAMDDGGTKNIVEGLEEEEEEPPKGKRLKGGSQKAAPNLAIAEEGGEEKMVDDEEEERIVMDSEEEEEEPPKKKTFRGRSPKATSNLTNVLDKEKDDVVKDKVMIGDGEGETIANHAEEGEKVMEDGEWRVVVENLEEVGDDMENMTLGQWFDRMEKFLPQVVNDVTEEIIAVLQSKARQFDEYVSKGSDVA